MIRPPPRSTLSSSSAASDVYKRQVYSEGGFSFASELFPGGSDHVPDDPKMMYWPRAQEEMSDNGNGSPKWVMVRNLTSKLVFRPRGISELYDFTTDPRELTNLYGMPSHAPLQQALMGTLAEWLVQTGDVPPVRNDARGPPKFPELLNSKSCADLMEPDPEVPFPYADPFDVNGVSN
eukprot:TRINITY_DN16768_c0_g1_i1.p1 TRINITY_DN16768_c0_g1~~TRINITY_DN16768_c0_g1_i1.p1  ORF type:complete len:178 (+),score=22.82 TRINITY_DN16768_c0_g1_i1:77-610(+)